MRFTSAIDMGRLWERSLRRADLPIGYSEGFSPHPKISFPDALPLGYASEGEYAELTFAVPVRVAAAMSALNASFPDGLQVLDAHAVHDGEPKLAKLLRASLWELAYSPATELLHAVTAANNATELIVARQRKGDAVQVDLRPAWHLAWTDGERVRTVLHHVEPAVRPTEVDVALRSFFPDLPPPALVTRLAQGQPADDGLVEALSGAPLGCAVLPLQRHAS